MCRRECPQCGGGTSPWPVRMPGGNRALLRGKEKTWGERSLVISCIYVKSFPKEERLFSFFSLLRFKTRWVGGRRWSGLRKAGFQLSQTLQTLGREDYRCGFDHGFGAQEMLHGRDESHAEFWRMKTSWMQAWSVPRSHSRGRNSSMVTRWEAGECHGYDYEFCNWTRIWMQTLLLVSCATLMQIEWWTPKDVYVLIPGTRDYAPLHGEGELRFLQMELSLLNSR